MTEKYGSQKRRNQGDSARLVVMRRVLGAVPQDLWSTEAMVRLASSDCGERLRVTKPSIEQIALLLCACILPVRAHRMCESAFSLAFASRLQLIYQALARVEASKEMLSVFRPEDRSVLHTSSRDALHSTKVQPIIL